MGRLRCLLVLPLMVGCVTAQYTGWTVYQEPISGKILRPGEADLAGCLAELGAPIYVREHGDGAMLAWGWSENRNWGVSVSVPIDNQSASFSYQHTNQGLEGLVLLFDENWTLTTIRRGVLARILPPAQVRAQAIEDE